jgi:hypothetical protein
MDDGAGAELTGSSHQQLGLGQALGRDAQWVGAAAQHIALDQTNDYPVEGLILAIDGEMAVGATLLQTARQGGQLVRREAAGIDRHRHHLGTALAAEAGGTVAGVEATAERHHDRLLVVVATHENASRIRSISCTSDSPAWRSLTAAKIVSSPADTSVLP